MLSSAAYAAFDVYASVYERLETMTIKWDVTTQKFIFTSNLNKLKFWILDTFIACIFCTGCCVFIITREIFYPSNKVGLILILFQIILSIVGFLWLIFAKVQDHCCPHKSIGDVVLRNQSVKLGRWQYFWKNKSTEDWVGLALLSLSVLYVFYPILLVLFMY